MPGGPALTPFNWLLAAAPLLIMLAAMLGLRLRGTHAGMLGFALAAALAQIGFGTLPAVLVVAAVRGLAVSFHVLYIIWAALLLYRLAEEVGAIRSIGEGVARLTEDHILQLLILGFAFASFLQGVAGFGVPVAIVAPLLVGLGFPPVQAAVVPLVGHAWSVTMGDMASSFQALRAVTGLPAARLGLWTALFLGLACLLTGFAIAHIHAGPRPFRRTFGAIVALGLAMGGTQAVLALLQHWIIASFAAGMVGLVMSLALARMARAPRGRRFWGLLPHWPGHDEERATAGAGARVQAGGGPGGGHSRGSGGAPAMGFHMAFAAYYVLIVVVVLATLLPPVHHLLLGWAVTVPFPATRTLLGWAVPEGSFVLHPLEHPGGLLSYTVAIAYLIYRAAGYWTPGRGRAVVGLVVAEGVPTSLAIVAMVMMAMVMTYSGMTFLLAKGIAAVTGPLYPLLAPFIGLLGAVVTGSNTNSNVLFGALQRDAALVLDLDPVVMAALQTTGGSLGSMVAPAKVLLATATVGLAGREGEVIGITFRYCLLMVAMAGVLGWALLTVVLR
ncbi:MAG: L-lactate permease [Armatimonadetes bacterium]|nr:L-lactate permease [Armatimonadota bacterium]